MRYLHRHPSRPSNIRDMELVARPLKPRWEHMRVNRQNIIQQPISRVENSSSRVLPYSHQLPLATKLSQRSISRQRQPTMQRLLLRALPMINLGQISGLGIMGYPQPQLNNFRQGGLFKQGTKIILTPLLLGPLLTNNTRIRCSSEVTSSRIMVPIIIATSDISPSLPYVLFKISL